MDAVAGKKIVLLFDEYSKDSKRLHNSFELAHADCDVVVINSDGFGPDGVCSVYDYFLDDFSTYDTYLGRPRYFNQVVIPEFWEITASMSSATVWNMNKEKAKIYFIDSSNNKRRVKVVEWFDDNGKVRLSDHYNKYGVLYARTSFSAKGEKVNKIYYSNKMQPIIYENYVTGAIILNYNNSERIFSNKADFITYYMKLRGYSSSRIYYNSLWYSFYVSERMPSESKDDILFWQEDARDDIPGNMKIILDDKSSRTQLIVVQKRDAYNKLIELGVSPAYLRLKGFIYPFERDNTGNANALIATNSDQVEHIEDLVKALPKVHFTIVALTEMSSKLMSMEKYDNVTLYPGVEKELLEELISKCDIYLDINKYSEICDIVYRAFLNNQIIFAFDETKHNAGYVAEENTYKSDDWENMAKDIDNACQNMDFRKERIEAQRARALAETEKSYALLK